MGKFGIFAIFLIVAGAHWLALQAQIEPEHHISKPKAKIHHITLSSVVVKKPVVVPKPLVEPIILPPDPEPVVEPTPKPVVHKVPPIILPADPEPKVVRQMQQPKVTPKKIKKKYPKKKHPKKRVKKQKQIEPIMIEEPIVMQEVVAPREHIDTSSLIDAYTAKVRRQIATHLFYPKMAKRMRMQGTVQVAFRVMRDGSVQGIRILSSPKKILSRGATKTIKSLHLDAIPREIKEPFLDIKIPIEFKLAKG